MSKKKQLWMFMGSRNHLWIPVVLGVLFGFWYWISSAGLDNDGYWILATGEELTKGIPKENVFTFVEDLQIVIQQWAWCLLCYKIYDAFGSYGIYIMCVILSLAVLAVYVGITKLRGLKWESGVKRGVLFLILMEPFLSIRPTFLTVLLLLLQTYFVERYIKIGKQHNLLPLILLALLEINFHSAVWVMHFIFLLPYLVPEIKNPLITFQKRKFSRKPFVWVIPAMAATGFLNPYGIDGITYLWRSYGKELKEIGIKELQAPAFDNLGILFIAVLVVFALMVQRAKLQNQLIFSSDCYLLCGTFIMGTMHTRNIVYFFFGAMIFSLEMIRRKQEKPPLKPFAGQLAWIAGILVLLSAISWTMENLPFTPKDNATTPVKAVQYLEEQGQQDAKIFTTFNSGGFFEWNGFQCFIDARPELYFKSINEKADVFQDYTALIQSSDPDKMERIIKKYDFDYFCIDEKTKLGLYLELNDYEVVVEGNGYLVFASN